MKKTIAIFITALLTGLIACKTEKPQPAGKFDKQMAWWKEARYGMFVHWGISTLIGEEISWSRNGYGVEKYDRLAQRFNPKEFDADKWITVAENAGMKYIVLTTKHHDGFCLWDSKANSHNIMNTPYGKDICRQLADACHQRGMRLGWYFSVREWNDSTCSAEGLNHLYVQKMKDELKELLTSYGKVDLLWFDYEGTANPADPQEIFDYCLSLQPDLVINNRLYSIHGNESICYTGNMGMYSTPEQFVGAYGETPWETCSTSSTSRQWSVRYNDPPRPAADMIWELMASAGGNGNMLMNVGPDSLGVIGNDYAATLSEMGDWIRTNDGVLYGTIGGPWKPTQEYVSTRNGKNANIIEKTGGDITLPYTKQIKVNKAYILATGEPVECSIDADTIRFTVPESAKGTPNLVIRLELNDDDIDVIPPFSTSGSLTYCKPGTASSSMSDKYMYCPSSAFDDMDYTTWLVGRRKDYDSIGIYGHNVHMCSKKADEAFESDAWIAVDLEKTEKVDSFRISISSTAGHIDLQFKDGENWTTAASKDNASGEWTGSITPQEARYWRINLTNGGSQLGIREFQLF